MCHQECIGKKHSGITKKFSDGSPIQAKTDGRSSHGSGLIISNWNDRAPK